MHNPLQPERSPNFEGWTCPLPLRDYPGIVLGHGGGGTLSAELIEHLFLPAFRNEQLEAMGDSAVLDLSREPGRLAFTTDSYVVRPLFFPGGSIGDLAVNGTVNDLAMAGAVPLSLSAAFILEEGFPIAELGEVVRQMAAAARNAGVSIVAGDTKVVEKGHGDGCYITTSGVGIVPAGRWVGPDRARAGDVVLVSGFLGDHGMAVMSVRNGLEFTTTIVSDSAPLNGLVEAMFAVCPEIRALRDPTRGGLATTLNEIATRSKVGIMIDEQAVPVRHEVQSACELLGLDPFYVANEGKLLAVVPAESADTVLEAMRKHPLGKDAAKIGLATERHPGMVVARTGIGGTRVVPMPLGEQLPRIC
jgi:hydrogenase expression/formation protein HypE